MKPGFERLFLAWAWTAQVGTIVALALIVLLGGEAWGAIAIVAAAGVGCAVVAPRLAAQLPTGLDGVLKRRRVMAPLVGLVVLLGLAQGTRLAAYMADDQLLWGSAVPWVEEGADHQCLPAYLYAGELNARGIADVYDPTLFPELKDRAEGDVVSSIAGMAAVVDDPYLYPPAFLLLLRLALAFSDDYAVLRLCVFAVNAVFFLIVGLALVGWIGGRRGLRVGLLLPLLWGSMPVLFTFQFGQFQLMALVLSLGAMLSFERKRHGLGGLLLASAVLGKVFPGILVLWLLFRGAWRPLAWTAGWGVVLTLLSLAVVGPATYGHFLFEHIPRLASGDVAPFFKETDFQITNNISVYGLAFKLQALGWIDNAETVAPLFNWVFTLALVLFTFLRARSQDADRHTHALVWVALLALASLRSPYVPGVYGFAGGLWVLSLLAPSAAGSAWRLAAVVLAWMLLAPLPPDGDRVVLLALSIVGPVIFLCVGFLALSDVGSRVPRVSGRVRRTGS